MKKKVKMICPKCDKKIDHLHNQSSQWVGYDMILGKGSYPNYEEYDNWEYNADDNCFVCPKCDRILFYEEENAIKFLKTGKYKK